MGISTLIPLKGANNTRDLGGMRAADGRTIKHNRLLRSGALADCNADEQKLLTDHGLKTIVDFRTALERNERPDPQMPGVEAIILPILNENTMGITREKPKEGVAKDPLSDFKPVGPSGKAYMIDIYAKIAAYQESRNQYSRFLDYVLNHEEGAILWHCSAGKDRVGVGSAMLQSALGIPRETIMKDYLATNDFTKEFVEDMQAKCTDPVMLEHITAVFTVEPAYLEAVFKAVEDEFGSVDAYLEKGLGLTPEKREKLKDMYLE